MVGVWLYRFILAYLAHPFAKFPHDIRHQSVSTLTKFTIYEATEAFRVEHSLSVPTENGVEDKFKGRRTSLMRWEKCKKRILIKNFDPKNQKETMSLATDFVEAV